MITAAAVFFTVSGFFGWAFIAGCAKAERFETQVRSKW